MIDWTAVLVAVAVVANLLSFLLLWLLHRELLGHRRETRLRADVADERAEAGRAEAVARDKAVHKLLAPVLRPHTRPVRGFLRHVREREGEAEKDGRESGSDAAEDLGAVAVILWRPGRSDDAERTVREVAG